MTEQPVAPKYTFRQKVYRLILIVVLLPVVAATSWLGYHMYQAANQRVILKNDYAELNNIQYGLLSVDRWRDNITDIVNDQIQRFELSGNQEDTLRKEINKILNALITQADEMINEKQKNVGAKIKKAAYNAFINVDRIRERVPEFSKTIIDEIKKPRSKQRLKYLAQDKLEDFAEQTRDSITITSRYDSLLAKYMVTTPEDFNRTIMQREQTLEQETYMYAFIILAILVLFIMAWLVTRKMAVLYTPLFTLSVLLALCVLLTGLSTPMIEIDARIQQINFILIGKNIQFHDQVLFYQSKSIIDVVHILIATKKPDAVFVGLLLLVFSIIFPIAKLLATKVHLLASHRWSNSKVVRFFAFKSGKWSMADVMVVAIFMAYIGFKGILDGQVQKMSDATTIATNKTSLQPGFILFIAFVLFGLILSVILKNISPARKKSE
jgi:hypothetical protein